MITSGTILGYHGCKAEVARKAVLQETSLQPSANGHDWLGNGIYFWAYDPVRALEWAAAQPAIRDGEVAAVGAVIDLGLCLNLSERTAVERVSEAHTYLRRMLEGQGRAEEMPRNRGGRRTLDHLVMETLHALRKERDLPPYDSVIGYFGEGRPIYEGAELRHQNHLQICVRDPRAVLGYFLPPRKG